MWQACLNALDVIKLYCMAQQAYDGNNDNLLRSFCGATPEYSETKAYVASWQGLSFADVFYPEKYMTGAGSDGYDLGNVRSDQNHDLTKVIQRSKDPTSTCGTCQSDGFRRYSSAWKQFYSGDAYPAPHACPYGSLAGELPAGYKTSDYSGTIGQCQHWAEDHGNYMPSRRQNVVNAGSFQKLPSADILFADNEIAVAVYSNPNQD